MPATHSLPARKLGPSEEPDDAAAAAAERALRRAEQRDRRCRPDTASRRTLDRLVERRRRRALIEHPEHSA
jgi:hypothetical protein